MTSQEYVDENSFPLTTQREPHRLKARDQIQIDSVILGAMRDCLEDGHQMTLEELARFQELEAKAKFWAEVWA